MKRSISVTIVVAAALFLAARLFSPFDPEPPAVQQPTEAVPAGDAAFLALAVPFIGRWEGKRNCAYFDPVGVATIGFGHTRTVTAADVRNRVCWSDARIERLLAEEIMEYRGRLRPYFTAETLRDRLPVRRDVAYTSLAFNVGWSGAGKSTAVRRLNDGDIRGGCKAIGWWNKAGGRVVQGLVNRRDEEVGLCLADL